MQREISRMVFKEHGADLKMINNVVTANNWSFTIDREGMVHLKALDPYDYENEDGDVDWDSMPDLKTFSSVDKLIGYIEAANDQFKIDNTSRITFIPFCHFEEENEKANKFNTGSINITMTHASLADENGSLTINANTTCLGNNYQCKLAIDRLDYGNLPVYNTGKFINKQLVNDTRESWPMIVDALRQGVDRVLVSSYIMDNYNVDIKTGKIGSRKTDKELCGLFEVCAGKTDVYHSSLEIFMKILEFSLNEGKSFEEFRRSVISACEGLPSASDIKEDANKLREEMISLEGDEYLALEEFFDNISADDEEAAMAFGGKIDVIKQQEEKEDAASVTNDFNRWLAPRNNISPNGFKTLLNSVCIAGTLIGPVTVSESTRAD